jgi:hypothetical protein
MATYTLTYTNQHYKDEYCFLLPSVTYAIFVEFLLNEVFTK